VFSTDDYGRGWRFPLVWVFGPLVLGALLVTGLGIAARASQGFPNIELAEEVRLAARQDDPLLADVTPFEWDRVCVFPPQASMDDVDDQLGFEWGVIGGDPSGDRTLLVFVRDGEVETHFFLEPSLISDPEGSGDCRGPEDESTRL
jgi:hypothetical protein